MSTFDLVAELPLVIEHYELEAHSKQLSPEFTRETTNFVLHGGGHVGKGEDVNYSADENVQLRELGPVWPLIGEFTFGSFAELIGELETFPNGAPEMEASRNYRRWAIESAALDLALRQAGTTLAAQLGREAKALTFVASLRLGDPASIEGVAERMKISPGIGFKLDPEQAWGDEIFAWLRGNAPVQTADLKGQYVGTVVDQPADPELYRKTVETFPEAWIEDPRLTDETDPILEPHRDRITWDAPIHSVADIEALPFAPRALNIKPSRLGGVQSLLDTHDYCEARGILRYGGGQSELSVGRGQIQYLASIFHPDTPNDVAPADYNLQPPPADLPTSPMEPRLSATGFRWEE